MVLKVRYLEYEERFIKIWKQILRYGIQFNYIKIVKQIVDK